MRQMSLWSIVGNPARWRPWRVFVYVAVPFGLFLVLATPPLQVDDEPAHFYKAFHVSEGHFSPAARKAEMPRSLLEYDDWAWNRFPLDPVQKLSGQELAALLRIPLLPGDRTEVGFLTLRYPFVIYLPQAMGVGLGRAAGLPVAGLMYLGRLANLAAYVALVAWALRRTPWLRWTLMLLALTPMAMRQAASLSGDALTNAVALALLAQILYLTARDSSGSHHEWRPVLVLCALAAALMLSKQLHCTLVLGVLAIPPGRLGGWRRYMGVQAAVGLASAGALAWSIWLGRVEYLSYLDDTGVGEHSGEQLAFLLGNPLGYAVMLFRSWWIQFLREPHLLESFVGYADWKRFYLMPSWFQLTWLLALGGTALLEAHPGRRMPGWTRLVLAANAVAGLAAVFTAFFLLTTGTGRHQVMGVVGRNLLPAAPFFLAAMGQWRRKPPAAFGSWQAGAAALALVSATVMALWTVHANYLPEKSVLPNGGFEQWAQGQAIPEGWVWQRPAQPSWTAAPDALESEWRGNTARQTWMRDAPLPSPIMEFGVIVEDLKPYSRYRLYVDARNTSQAAIRLMACELATQPGGYLVPTLFQQVVRIEPGNHWQGYAGAFYTRGNTTVRIYTQLADASGGLPATVYWDNWRLNRVPFGLPWRALWLRHTEGLSHE